MTVMKFAEILRAAIANKAISANAEIRVIVMEYGNPEPVMAFSDPEIVFDDEGDNVIVVGKMPKGA